MRVPMPIIGSQLVLEHIANYALAPPKFPLQAYDSSCRAADRGQIHQPAHTTDHCGSASKTANRFGGKRQDTELTWRADGGRARAEVVTEIGAARGEHASSRNNYARLEAHARLLLVDL